VGSEKKKIHHQGRSNSKEIWQKKEIKSTNKMGGSSDHSSDLIRTTQRRRENPSREIGF